MNAVLEQPMIIAGVGHVSPPAGITPADADRLAYEADLARLADALGVHAGLAPELLEARRTGRVAQFADRYRTIIPAAFLRHVLGYSVALRNAQLDEITAAIGTSGLLRIYDGTRPATGGTATTLLAELALSSTAAAAASSGVLTFNAISSDTSANATGTATWWRLATSGGTAVIDGSAGTSGADINFNSVSFVSGATIAVSSLTITAGNA